MKEISITLWELTKDEVNRLPEGTRVLMYDSLRSCHMIDATGKHFIYSKLELSFEGFSFFTFEKPKLRITLYYIVGRSMGEEPDEESHDVKVGPFITTESALEEMYKMSEELTLAGQHIYSGLYIDSEEVYL